MNDSADCAIALGPRFTPPAARRSHPSFANATENADHMRKQRDREPTQAVHGGAPFCYRFLMRSVHNAAFIHDNPQLHLLVSFVNHAHPFNMDTATRLSIISLIISATTALLAGVIGGWFSLTAAERTRQAEAEKLFHEQRQAFINAATALELFGIRPLLRSASRTAAASRDPALRWAFEQQLAYGFALFCTCFSVYYTRSAAIMYTTEQSKARTLVIMIWRTFSSHFKWTNEDADLIATECGFPKANGAWTLRPHGDFWEKWSDPASPIRNLRQGVRGTIDRVVERAVSLQGHDVDGILGDETLLYLAALLRELRQLLTNTDVDGSLYEHFRQRAVARSRIHKINTPGMPLSFRLYPATLTARIRLYLADRIVGNATSDQEIMEGSDTFYHRFKLYLMRAVPRPENEPFDGRFWGRPASGPTDWARLFDGDEERYFQVAYSAMLTKLDAEMQPSAERTPHSGSGRSRAVEG